MSIEMLNARGATPEVVLTKALESGPQKVVVIMMNADGTQTTLMSYMPSQDLAWLKANFDAQFNAFFSDRIS